MFNSVNSHVVILLPPRILTLDKAERRTDSPSLRSHDILSDWADLSHVSVWLARLIVVH
jgi:hypothetical protein